MAEEGLGADARAGGAGGPEGEEDGVPVDHEGVLGQGGDEAVHVEGEGGGARGDDAAEAVRVGGGGERVPAYVV